MFFNSIFEDLSIESEFFRSRKRKILKSSVPFALKKMFLRCLGGYSNIVYNCRSVLLAYKKKAAARLENSFDY